MPSNVRAITKDTFFLFLARVIGLGLGLLRLKFLAVYFNVDLFGVYFFATSFVAMFAILFDLELGVNPYRHLYRAA